MKALQLVAEALFNEEMADKLFVSKRNECPADAGCILRLSGREKGHDRAGYR